VSKHLVADAYFSKKSFVDQLVAGGFELVSRLRSDAHLRYLYTGPKENRPGRPRQFAGRISVRELSEEVFTPCAIAEDGSWIGYTAVVNVKAWKRSARVVIVHDLDAEGAITGHRIYVTTDCSLDGGETLHIYQCRFHQEFIYRDAKQELGLEHCQAYSWQKIDFHINMSLTAASLAKAAHHLDDPEKRKTPFSIADIKTRYVNEYQGRRIITMFGIDPDSAIIRKMWPIISKLGLRTG
jgi:SRSO17 transposase